MNENLLSMEEVHYHYGKKEKNVILEGADYVFSDSKMYAILGKSGIGKSTTIALLGALDTPQKGRILYGGEDIRSIGYQKYRSKDVSIIFQDYNLLNYLNGYQNIELAMELSRNVKKKDKKERRQEILRLLKSVGIEEETAKRNVRLLSGGEQQRIAIARALAAGSKIILADEPTGNLDLETAGEIINILHRLACEEGKCVIAVTHTRELAGRADQVLTLRDGKIYER